MLERQLLLAFLRGKQCDIFSLEPSQPKSQTIKVDMRNSIYCLADMSSLADSDARLFYSTLSNFPVIDMILVDRQSKCANFIQKTMSTINVHMGSQYAELKKFANPKFIEKEKFSISSPRNNSGKFSLGAYILDLLFEKKGHSVTVDEKNQKLIFRDPQGKEMSGVHFIYAIGHDGRVEGPPIKNVFYIDRKTMIQDLGILF